MSKSLLEMAQEIVQAQASAKPMMMDEIKTALQEAFQTLKGLQSMEGGVASVEAPTQPELDPKKSIKRNCIVCLECGAEFKMLSPKHLASHGLDSKSYRKKYGFSARQSLCAKSLSDRRSESGKNRGLPENLRKYLDARTAQKQSLEANASQAQIAATANAGKKGKAKIGKEPHAAPEA